MFESSNITHLTLHNWVELSSGECNLLLPLG